jgi:hypothetical protein
MLSSYRQGVFILSHLTNNISYLKEIVDKSLRMRYKRSYMTTHPGGNCVEPDKSPCPAHPSA